MIKNNNIPYYLVVIILFILFKFGFRLATNNSLLLLLKPTDYLVGILIGSKSVYFANSGYYHNQLNFLIDKSCSGFNFMLLSFLMLTLLGLKHFDSNVKKVITIPVAIITAYLLTIFANTSRIFSSIVVQNHTNNSLVNYQNIIHESIGITIYLTFLVLTYFLVDKNLINWRTDAKLT